MLNTPKKPLSPFIENKPLNITGENLKSLLKKPAYSRAKSFKL